MRVFLLLYPVKKQSMIEPTSISHLHSCFKQSTGVCTDTRNIKSGSFFVALKGENFDGNTFVLQALALGAKYALTSNKEHAHNENILYCENTLQTLQELAAYHRKQFQIPVIAITGSNGKTTTKELVYAVLSRKYAVLATQGNLNNHIGVPLTLLKIQDSHQMAVIEMGANHQGEIALLCDIAAPNYGLISNIGKAHLEGFGGIEGVIKGKTELYSYLKMTNGTVIYQADNVILKEKAAGILNNISYAYSQMADCQGSILSEQPYLKISFSFKKQATSVVDSHLIGRYNAENILSAVCIGKHFGVDDSQIARAVFDYIPDNSRSQILKKEEATIILDAYNANPSSMKAAIENFKEMQAPQKMIILGDMFELGESSASEHEQIIQEALKLEVPCIFVGVRFGAFKDKYKGLFFDAILPCEGYLKTLQKKNITVLIKGSRGMKMEQLTALF